MAISSEYWNNAAAMQYQKRYVNELVVKLSLDEHRTRVNVLGYGVGGVLTAVVPAVFDPAAAAITAGFADPDAHSTSAIHTAVSAFSSGIPAAGTSGTSGAGVLRFLTTYGTHMRDSGGGLVVFGPGAATKAERRAIAAARKRMPTVPVLCVFAEGGSDSTTGPLFRQSDDDGNLCDVLLTRQSTEHNIDNSVGIALGLLCEQDTDKKPADPCASIGNNKRACQQVRRNYRGQANDDPTVIASGAIYRFDTQCYFNKKVKCQVKGKYEHIYQ